MSPGLVTLRGIGPVPAGYFRCYSTKCPARRATGSGRREPHYHPITPRTRAAKKLGR